MTKFLMKISFCILAIVTLKEVHADVCPINSDFPNQETYLSVKVLPDGRLTFYSCFFENGVACGAYNGGRAYREIDLKNYKELMRRQAPLQSRFLMHPSAYLVKQVIEGKFQKFPESCWNRGGDSHELRRLTQAMLDGVDAMLRPALASSIAEFWNKAIDAAVTPPVSNKVPVTPSAQ